MRNLGKLALVLVAACSGSDTATDTSHRSKLPTQPAAAAVALGATPIAVDANGMPRMLQGQHVPAAPAATATESARTHLARLAPAWGVSKLPELVGLGEVAAQGGRIARVQQQIDGLPIDRGELRVMIGAGGTLVAASGVLRDGDAPRTAKVFGEDDRGAIARAVAHTYQTAFSRTALAPSGALLRGAGNGIDVEMARAKQVWYPQGDILVAAWVVEAYTSKLDSTDSQLYRTVLSADGRRVLEHRSLQDDVAFQYKVFADTTGELHPQDGPTEDASPHPTGTPNGSFPAYAAPSLVSVDGLNHNPDGTSDPWLASTRTETQGNNVEAYTDFNAPSGLTFGDFRATTTSQRTFDRTYDLNAEPLSSQAQQMAGITSLFYVLNWLHDFWYDAGFTEVAGNGQDNNYGRGGEDRDALLAEAQDNALGGSRNNANMNTPDDGLPPRMQVFLWSGKTDLALTAGAATPDTNSAAFGPKAFDITAQAILANDGVGTASDACEALPAATGKIVVVDRGTCSFKKKALAVQQAGGVGMLLVNNAAGNVPPAMGEDTTITTTITIGVLSMTMADGATLKTAIAGGATNSTMHRLSGPELEGAIDATLIAHEFGHYLHHRLSLCGTRMCGAMSEGWGDFSSLMLLARPGDNLDGAYPFSVYTTQSFSDDAAYFGIRRAPYSVNPAINNLSFRHMMDGEALPTDIPFLVFGNNAEVHNAGEIWAATMWEVYVALQKAGASFTDVRTKMAKYVVEGLLMAPVDASPMEMRDSLLTVMHAKSPADHDLAAAAFAKRGMGSCAVAPPPESTTFSGIVESTIVAGRATLGAQTSEAATSCDDDNVLDPGESLRITVPLANRGHKALTNITATLTSATPGITVTSAPVTIASIDAYTSAEVVAEVKLEGDLAEPTAGDFTLKIAATGGCEAEVEQQFGIRLNADDVPESSATDSFDTETSIWTATTSAVPVWTHQRESALDGLWRGADLGATSDTSLVSPAVTVGDAPFVVTLKHAWDFEVGQGTAFDGGVVEFTTDGGSTWNDVSSVATPGYTGTLDAGNALGARMAFTGKNPANPDPDTLTLDFGTQLAGKTVQLRFRIGTDSGVGAPGWSIDDVAMTGISGTPFPTQAADTGTCTTQPPGDDDDGDGGCCDAGPVRVGNLGAGLAVLALVLRRRRRRS